MRVSRSALLVLALGGATGACTQERAPVGTPSAAGVGVAAAGSNPAGGGDGGAQGDGGAPSSGPGPAPEVDDCACLAATPDPACRSCLDEAAIGLCVTEATACDAAEPGYCALVLDCTALCPTADAFCVDACLGADDSSRDAVEAFAACACDACATACGDGACE